MSDQCKSEDDVGTVLAQVHDDLRQLKCSLEKIQASERGSRLDIEALNNAICRTENSIRKHSEDYLKILNRRHLVLPDIEDLQKQTVKITKWKLPLESVPDVHQQKKGLPGESPKEKHNINTHLPCVPAHSNNREDVRKKCALSFPDVLKSGPTTWISAYRVDEVICLLSKTELHKAKHSRRITGSVCLQATETKGLCLPSLPEDKMGTVQKKAVSLKPRQGPHLYKPGLNSRYHKQPKLQTESHSISVRKVGECPPLGITKATPPFNVSKHMDQRGNVEGTSTVNSKCPQNTPVEVPENITKYPFTIIKGQIDPVAADYCHFKQSFSLCWNSIVDTLSALKELLRDYAVPLAKVNGELLVELCHCWDNGWSKAPVSALLSVLENQEEVSRLISRPGQRYKGEGGIEAAATRIQSCWRRYLARTAYLSLCRRKWAVGIISISWLMHTQKRRVRSALKARRLSQLENNRSRAQHLAANWKHIQSSKRTIIHIPSLGYSQKQQLNLRQCGILQNTQISRVCDIRDENVNVLYISPKHLGDNILQYYTSILKCDKAAYGTGTRTSQASSPCKRRFIILTPEAVDYFPNHNMCLSTLLKYSPRTLKRIRNLILGKQAYIVGGVAHVDDLAVADELDVPILGPEPAVSQLCNTKSEGRRIFAVAKVDVPPGQGDVYSLNQLHVTLAKLLTENITVERWLFKMNSDHGDRGTAYCDVCHLSCFNWAQQQYHRYSPDLWASEWIQESVQLKYLDVIPEWLAHYAQPSKTSCYPSWACFLKTFLRQGGVVEANPPSESITYLTVDLLLEPGGGVTMMSCGDQLHSSCYLEAVGSTVPQTSVHPEQLHTICMRVGQACLQRLIVGYVSVGLATFLDRCTMEQKVWAVNLNVTYSDQLAMTQMLLMMTGGTLNWRTGCVEVPVSIREKCSEQRRAAKPPVVYVYAVIGTHLFHTNLSMLYHNVFLKKCKDQGIVFNMKRKQGTVFVFYDSSERCNIGMITVSEDLQQALVTFAQNLSVIHQDISSSKIRGETNFKELIKNIEDVLQMTFQNKRQLKDKPSA